MQTTALDALRQEAERQYLDLKARKRRRYRLARDLGFSAKEAKLLSGRSELYIATLAKELQSTHPLR